MKGNDEEWPEETRTASCGLHPGTTCARTGEKPIVGVLYRAASGDLCQAAFGELTEAEKTEYETVSPTAFASRDPTDDDDGLLACQLPGTRRAIQLLVRKAQQLRFVDFTFFDLSHSVMEALEDRELLCEYIELLVAAEVNDDLFDDVEAYLEGARLPAAPIARPAAHAITTGHRRAC